MAALKQTTAWRGRHPLLRRILVAFTLVGLVGPQNAYGQAADDELPKGKQTTLGLYVTAKEAYEIWKAAPDKVKILDVRTPEEYIFVGHAPMAVNIPAFLQSYEWDGDKHHYAMTPNPDFVAQVKATFALDDDLTPSSRTISATRAPSAERTSACLSFPMICSGVYRFWPI